MPAPVVSIFDSSDYDEQINRARSALTSGGVVVLPTETVYGAASLLSHPQGRQRLTELRGGDRSRPFTVHLAHREDAAELIDLSQVGELGRRMMQKLWPGPVALIFDVPAAVREASADALGIAQGDVYDAAGAITLRCPDHVVFDDVVGPIDGPVALTVAGSTPGGPSWSASEAAAELGDKVDLILDAGPTRLSKPSTIIRVRPDSYQILRAGIYDERIIEKMLKTTILFVCSGNTCRSPMAEALARRILARKYEVPETELERKGINVVSAGSFAMPGARATPQGVEALRDMGIDLSQHRSKPLSVELIHQADHIFTMGRAHALQVAALVPSAREKVSTLDPSGDIDDPIGGDTALYKDLAGHLETLIEQRLKEMKT
jgi:tRNA threonylcarbamoyl adenosine modification protein (Sua5/YciO/YrdC/YwlC family)